MAVSGRELSSLDFGNLIGGPLNAIVEAQAKSAVTTANFIREVAFDKDGKAVNVDFSYEKSNANGSKQNFKLTVPFLTMLPIPYIKVDDAVVEFNAKITSTTESNSSSNFSQVVDSSVGANYWFVSTKINSKTSFQKTSSTTDKEERSFDMHIKVNVSNTDMPAGTERILNMLEESIGETAEKVTMVPVALKKIDTSTKTLTISTTDAGNIVKNMKVYYQGEDTGYAVDTFDGKEKLECTLSGAAAAPVLPENAALELRAP